MLSFNYSDNINSDICDIIVFAKWKHIPAYMYEMLTLTVLVTTIDALQHFETG